MKLRKPTSFASALALALLCSSTPPLGAQTPSPAPSAGKVVSLRLSSVTVYKAPNGEKVRDYPGGKLDPGWPVVGHDGGFLKVQIGSETLWVRKYAVDTDIPFRVPADCGATFAEKQPKAGVTRGIGDACKK